jgi:Ca-activated chloride channel homolog
MGQMRARFPLTSAAAVLVICAANAQQQQTFRSSVNTVSLYATVRGDDDRLEPYLTREDFVIFDNGKPQETTVFRKEVVPITVVLMLDMSGSTGGRAAFMRTAGEAFVTPLLPEDRARVGTFGKEIAVSPRLTNDHGYLLRILNRELWPGGFTPLWRAIDVAMSSLVDEVGRRVVLVVTDGMDTMGGHPFGVTVRAQREGFIVYGVGLPSGAQASSRPPADGGFAKDIRNLALDSGGGFIQPTKSADLRSTMARVVDELHHQYALGFTPQVLDGKTHRLEVKVKRAGLSVRTRKNYVAEAGK